METYQAQFPARQFTLDGKTARLMVINSWMLGLDSRKSRFYCVIEYICEYVVPNNYKN